MGRDWLGIFVISENIVDVRESIVQRLMKAFYDAQEKVLNELVPQQLSHDDQCRWLEDNDVRFVYLANDNPLESKLWAQNKCLGEFVIKWPEPHSKDLTWKIIFNWFP